MSNTVFRASFLRCWLLFWLDAFPLILPWTGSRDGSLIGPGPWPSLYPFVLFCRPLLLFFIFWLNDFFEDLLVNRAEPGARASGHWVCIWWWVWRGSWLPFWLWMYCWVGGTARSPATGPWLDVALPVEMAAWTLAPVALPWLFLFA